MLQFRFNPQMHDYFEFMLYHHWYSPDKRSFRKSFFLRTAMWILAPVVVYCFFLLNPVNDDIRFPLLAGCSASSIYMLYAYLTYKKRVHSTTVKFYMDPLNKSFFEETYIGIENGKLIAKQTSSITEMPVGAIVKVVENKGTYYLYTNSMQAIIIPKRAFDNNEKHTALKKIFNLP
jgi:YcxB-like protein